MRALVRLGLKISGVTLRLWAHSWIGNSEGTVLVSEHPNSGLELSGRGKHVQEDIPRRVPQDLNGFSRTFAVLKHVRLTDWGMHEA